MSILLRWRDQKKLYTTRSSLTEALNILRGKKESKEENEVDKELERKLRYRRRRKPPGLMTLIRSLALLGIVIFLMKYLSEMASR